MSAAVEMRSLWRFSRCLLTLVLCLSAAAAWAGLQKLASKPHNHPEAPVEIRRSQANLVEAFPSPNQIVVPGSSARLSRVRYANRAGQAQIIHLLKGTLVCRNQSRKTVKMLGLRIVPMDAFHEPLALSVQKGMSELMQVEVSLAGGDERLIEWEQEGASSDVYGVAVIIERIRFEDGSIWKAPATELIDIF